MRDMGPILEELEYLRQQVKVLAGTNYISHKKYTEEWHKRKAAEKELQSLITTIESQQEKISELEAAYREIKDELNIIVATENSLIESQKEEIQKLQQQISTFQAWQPNSWDSHLQIESLKAITELAVNCLKEVLKDAPWESDSYTIAFKTLSEIERLTHE